MNEAELARLVRSNLEQRIGALVAENLELAIQLHRANERLAEEELRAMVTEEKIQDKENNSS